MADAKNLLHLDFHSEVFSSHSADVDNTVSQEDTYHVPMDTGTF